VIAAAPVSANSIVGQNLMKPGALFIRHARSGNARSIQSGQSATTGDIRLFAYPKLYAKRYPKGSTGKTP
jgi:hypothetical protein